MDLLWIVAQLPDNYVVLRTHLHNQGVKPITFVLASYKLLNGGDKIGGPHWAHLGALLNKMRT